MTPGSSNPSVAAALVSTALSRVLVRSATKNPAARTGPPGAMTEIPSFRMDRARLPDEAIKLGGEDLAAPASPETMNAAVGESLSTRTTSRPLGIRPGAVRTARSAAPDRP